MPIKHAFVSAKSDGGDATLVRPSNWNADHEGSGWTQVINEDGSSLTNWTSHVGTWASSAGEITATNAGADQTLRYSATPIDWASGFIYETELQAVSGSGDHPIGLWMGTNSSASAGGFLVALNTNNTIQFERFQQAIISTLSMTVSTATWYRLRIVLLGGNIASVYVDGTFRGAGTLGLSAPIDAVYVGIRAYQISAKFRNIKAWTLDHPA